MNLAESRNQFGDGVLELNQLDADPLRQFMRWFSDAETAGEPQAAGMVLATVNAEGMPSARMVFLRGLDSRGFLFYTNLRSRKACEMAANPRVALAFHWQKLERQVRVEGTIEDVADDVADAYFATRPRGSQLGAWASPQSEVIASRHELEVKLAELEMRFGDGPIPRPDYWGGYRVVPSCIQFWQGRVSRLHDCFRYRPDGSERWVIERLGP
jgi:pyridoxamine 5'-phosphate oxidase